MIADAIKIKVLKVVSIMAVTALLICSYTISNQSDIIAGQTEELASLNTLMEVQRESINSLKEDLDTKPKEYIKIVKEVDKRLCEGIVLGKEILDLPITSKKKGALVLEIDTENGTADIDDKLPANIIQLLQ